MASSREIVNDLRAQARAIERSHLEFMMVDGLARSLLRGADEIERLLDELTYLRGFAEAHLEAERRASAEAVS